MRALVRISAGLMLACGASVALAQRAPLQPAAPGSVTTRPVARASAPLDGYSADGRRDPFVSLLRMGADPDGRANVPRPPGVAGLYVSEVALKGVVASPQGFAALLQGSDTKTYVVHAGDRLMDGQVRLITADGIVLLQRSNDPLVVPRDVEIRKRLRQIGEGKP